VGLGSAARVESVRVHWPAGNVEEWKEPLIDQYMTWKEGAAPVKK